MVEFALVLPILLLVVYGLLEVGRLLFIYSSVVSAARQASRYGATTGVNASGTLRYRDCTGMRAAAQRVGFIDDIADTDIEIWHDEGEGANQIAYCPPGQAIDSTNFQPSTGNLSRIRVRVHADYAPIVPLVPLGPLTIESVSARTILVSVPIAITAAPQGWDPNATPIPPIPTDTLVPTYTSTPSTTPTASPTGTATGTATNTVSPTVTFTPSETPIVTNTATATNTFTPSPTSANSPTPTPTTPPCSVSHSTLKIIVSDPKKVSMTLQNDLASTLTIHIKSIKVTFNEDNGQKIKVFFIIPDQIWSGNTGSPLTINIANPTNATYTFAPNVSKILTAEFSKDYVFSAGNNFEITFVEPECPVVTVTQ